MFVQRFALVVYLPGDEVVFGFGDADFLAGKLSGFFCGLATEDGFVALHDDAGSLVGVNHVLHVCLLPQFAEGLLALEVAQVLVAFGGVLLVAELLFLTVAIVAVDGLSDNCLFHCI